MLFSVLGFIWFNLQFKVMKKILICLTIILACVLTVYTSVEAAYLDKGLVKGAKFKVGDKNLKSGSKETSLKFLKDLASKPNEDNLDAEISGPDFDDIDNDFKGQFAFKVYNDSDATMKLASKSDYVEDDKKIRYGIFAKVNKWDDKNDNGKVDSSEIGDKYAEDSILRWRNDTFKLGEVKSKEVNGYVLTFDGRELTEKHKGASATYDFEIYSDTAK
jgi:hypothetical protein